ncbi:Ribokinase-like protein [Coniochaeta sp. 2T2.1]|nr:Ribokinase-like protein [Coniochaeta sp. 2T2.1]
MATPRITVLGSLNIDLVSYVPHHPLPGETLTASSFAVSPGGKGANQAVACAKLSFNRQTNHKSADVYMVGAVGDDSYGDLLRGNMSRNGVIVDGVTVGKGLKTGIAIIVVDEPTGQNRIILSPEANHSLQPEAFTADKFDESLGVGREPDLLILQLEIPLETVLRVIKTAREKGTKVLLNPAPAVKLPDWVYEGLEHLVVNETEASVLGGVEESVLDTEEGLERVSRGFVEKGVRNVIVTLGGRGVYYMSAEGKKGLVPAQKAKVVDTTAAGDTSVGQYALEAVQKGEFDIEAAVRKANRAGAKAVERLGAQDSIPYGDELE